KNLLPDDAAAPFATTSAASLPPTPACAFTQPSLTDPLPSSLSLWYILLTASARNLVLAHPSLPAFFIACIAALESASTITAPCFCPTNAPTTPATSASHTITPVPIGRPHNK